MKECTLCGEAKPLTDFHRQSSAKDGHCCWCKPCKSEKKRATYAANAGNVKARVAAYRAANPEKTAAAKRAAYLKKHEQYKAKNRAAYRRDPERKKKYQAEYLRKNRLAVNAASARYKRERLRNDPLFRAEYSMRARVFLAFRNKGLPQRGRTREILGCEWAELKAHMEARFTAGMSWDNYGKWHVDHIIPLSSATTEAELVRLCHFTNLQPLWAADNIRKGARLAA